MKILGMEFGRVGKVGAVADAVHNRESEIAPNEWENPPQKEETEDERADVELVLERYREASMHRRAVERDWVVASAMVEGRQWLGWDDAAHKAISLIDDEEPDRYVTDNLTRPLIAKAIALATMTKPDASVAPDSDALVDRLAASEGRAITAHLYRANGGQLHTQEVATWAAVCGVGYSKERWDRSKSASVPTFGADGQIAGKKSLPVGEAVSDVLSPFEVYIDPLAKRWGDAQWFIHAKILPLSWFQTQFPEMGKLVEPDHGDPYGGFGDGYMQAAYGGVSQIREWFGGAKVRKAAVYYEMWEKPSPRFPKGRYIAIAGNRRLTPANAAWPTPPGPNGEFPLARCTYQEAIGHCYGRGLVADLAPLQVAYNRLLSRVVERIEQDKLTVVVAKGAGLGADAYDTDEGRNVRKIYFDGVDGAAPAFQQPPPVTGDIWRLKEAVWMDMQHIAGIHEVNMGDTPPGITAGVSIELLQQGDKTQLGLFTGSIEQFAVLRDQLRIGLYARYVAPQLPRMMGLDDSGNPQAARSKALAFRALTQGGSCTVMVEPGSATPKSAAGEQQEILEFMKAGLFGPPGSPDAASIAVQLMSLTRSDMVLERLREQADKAAANQPNPAQMEQLRQQGAQRQLSLQTQHAAEMAAIQEQHRQAADAQKNEHEMRMAWLDKVVPSLSGTMDAAAVADLERRLGLGVTAESAPSAGVPAEQTAGVPGPVVARVNGRAIGVGRVSQVPVA